MSVVHIIGAGMAGSYASSLAVQETHEVRVYERIRSSDWQNPLRGRKCGEGVWEKKLRDAGIQPDNKPWVDNKLTNILLGRISEDRIVSEHSGLCDPYLVIDRQGFANYYLDQAISSGAVFTNGSAERSIAQFVSDNSEGYVIGAWGTNARLTRSIISRDVTRYVMSCQYTMSGVNTKVLDNAKCIYFSDDPNVAFYWIFPVEESNSGRANIGVMFTSSKISKPFEYLDLFLRLNPRRAFTSTEILEQRTFAKPISVGEPVTPEELSSYPNLFLVGDAAGVCSSVSGGGIGYALQSALHTITAISKKDPLKYLTDSMKQVYEDLRRDLSLSAKMYPQNPLVKREINDKIFELVEQVMLTSDTRQLSLSNLLRELLTEH